MTIQLPLHDIDYIFLGLEPPAMTRLEQVEPETELRWPASLLVSRISLNQDFESSFWPKKTGSGALCLVQREIYKILLHEYLR